jgi:hypothetical protein
LPLDQPAGGEGAFKRFGTGRAHFASPRACQPRLQQNAVALLTRYDRPEAAVDVVASRGYRRAPQFRPTWYIDGTRSFVDPFSHYFPTARLASFVH